MPLSMMIVLMLFACLVSAAPEKDNNQVGRVPLGLDLYRAIPDDNPLTPEKVALGRRLFFDPLLSKDRSLSCADCHQPDRAFTDGRGLSVGISGRQGKRSVPTLINRAYGEHFFWDGRISTLEEQVLQPIVNPLEMGLQLEEAVSRLKVHHDYASEFSRTFDHEPTSENLSLALSSFVRTVLSGNSPYDRFQSGEKAALTQEARVGLRLFQGKARCTQCHTGPNLTDEDFHNTGVAWKDGGLADEGRFRVTNRRQDKGAFKTPTLREIAKTAPYMHDGSRSSLEEVIDFYDGGGIANPYLDDSIRPLNLTVQEKQQLASFLDSLSGQPD